MKIDSARKVLLVAALACGLALVAGLAGCGGGGSEPAAQAAEPSATAPAPVAWTPDSNCSVCHKDQAADDSTAATHGAAGVDCSSCHTDTSALTTVHEDISGTAEVSGLTITTVAPETCTGCHDMTEVAAATAGSAALTDTNGTVVNPHSVPVSEDHATLTCVSCHKMHSSTPVATTAMRACTSCHHANVFECGTCHSVE